MHFGFVTVVLVDVHLQKKKKTARTSVGRTNAINQRLVEMLVNLVKLKPHKVNALET